MKFFLLKLYTIKSWQQKRTHQQSYLQFPHPSYSQAKAIKSETLVDESSSSSKSNTNDLIAQSATPPTRDNLSDSIKTTTKDPEENVINSNSTTTQGKRSKRTPKYLQDYD